MDQLKLFDIPQTTNTSDDYWTPKWIFDALGLTFDLDVACPPEGPVHTPCKAFYTQADDGLAQPWHGLVWMNPPYSKPHKWVEKFIIHRNGISLTVVSKSKWFNELWHTADALMMMPPNLKFDQGPIFMPTIMAAYGTQSAAALHDSNIGRVR
jgi:phage N-6-adenine-methyltransferase